MSKHISRREVLRYAALAATLPHTGLVGRIAGASARPGHAGVGSAAAGSSAVHGLAPVSRVVEPFALDRVSLSSSMFREKRDRMLTYARAYPPDRLLALFRSTAGLPTLDAQPPGGWETATQQLRGHFAGHSMTQLAQAYADTGEAVFKANLDYMVTELGKCQEALDARSARRRVPGISGSGVRFHAAPHPQQQTTIPIVPVQPPSTGAPANTIWPSEYLALPTGIVAGLADFTVCVWVKPETISNGARIFDFGSGTNTTMYLATLAPPPVAGSPAPGAAVLKFAITTNGAPGEQPLAAAVQLSTTQWTHVAVTLAGTTATLYVNGALAATNPAVTLRPSSLGVTTQNWIGRSQGSSIAEPPPASADPFFNGSVDEFRIYGRSLSAQQVAALAASPGGGSADGIVAWYRFDDPDGAAVVDSSGNGLHATIAGVPSHPGYLAAFPETQFVQLEALRGNPPVWAPWYTCHKIMRGFIDAHHLTGNEQALEIVLKMGDWAHSRLGRLPRSQLDGMWAIYSAGEYGAMGEIMAELYGLTGKEEYLATARCFDNTPLFNATINNQDTLDGKHANQHIPQFLAYLRIFEQTGETGYHTSAQNFWGMVVPHRMYSQGGTSHSEFFRQRGVIAGRLGANTAETCCAHNMLKVSRNLFFHDPLPKYMDYYERALANQILGSRRDIDSITTTECTYHQGTTPGVRKVYNTYGATGTCCAGTGLENHTKYQDSIYFRAADGSTLYVNLYLASTLRWPEKGLVLTQATNYPFEGTSSLTVDGSGPLDITLRVPYWVRQGYTVTINGVDQAVEATPGTYVTLSRVWAAGDVIDISMPFSLRVEQTPDDPTIQSLFFGPILLVVRDASTTMLQLTLSEDLAQSVTPAGTPMHFTTNGHQLAPFFIGDAEPYHMYFKRLA